jgi:hypothetical protein
LENLLWRRLRTPPASICDRSTKDDDSDISSRSVPASSIEGLSIKFDVLHWALYHDRPDLFEARRLAALGRELRAFARSGDDRRI